MYSQIYCKILIATNKVISTGLITASLAVMVSQKTQAVTPVPTVSPVPPGLTPDNPILPVVNGDTWSFSFNVTSTTTRYFIDPDVAIGYDYIVDSGQNISSVLLPTGIGDNSYQLWTDNSSGGCAGFSDSGQVLTGGSSFSFGSPAPCFSIRGIEVEAGLDPNNTRAFVTGLTFAQSGVVNMRQIPILAPQTVPEPLTIIGSFAALGFMGKLERRFQKNKKKNNNAQA